MSRDWINCNLGDQITLQRGFDITRKQMTEGNIPVISSSGIVGFHDVAKVGGPGVIIGRKGTLGTVHYVQDSYWPHDTTLWVKDYKGNLPKFVYYYLQTLNLQRFDVGSANPTLNRNHVHPIPIKWPELALQNKIVEIISSFDDKIQVNQRMNQTLEMMARNLYKHWFVDFGPFQDGEFEDSGLGMIPKGWTVRSVYELATFVNGMAFKQPHLNDEKKGLPVIKISELNANSIMKAKYFEGNYQEKYQLNTGDVLFAWSASLGIYLWSHGEALLNQHIFNVQPNGMFSKAFLYFLLKEIIDEFKEIAAARATTMGHITKEHLQSKYLPYPTMDVLKKTDEIFTNLFRMVLGNEVENNNLIETRDYLLVRLLSGEIEMKEVEKQVEEVL